MEIRVHIAVLVIAADPNRADPAAADVIAQKAVGAGHSIVARVTVGDSIEAIRAQLKTWIDDTEIDVAIVTAGTDTKHASDALKPLVHEAVPGFTDLFRWLAFQEIGASAMMASAEAARCGTTFVFVLPAVANSAGTAMDKLILPQLDVRANTRNLVAQMPRLQVLVPSAPIVADSQTDKTEAVPHAVTMERTESGPGLHPRLPASQNIVRKELPPLKPKPPADEATKIISTEQLERKIAQSNQHDAVTKPNVDIAKLLPRVPPGADDFDDAETADIADVLAGVRPKAPTPAKPLNIVRKPPSVQIPARTKPPSNVPIILKKDESGRVVIPAKDPASGPIGKAKLPPSTADDEAPTVPSKTPAKIADAIKAEVKPTVQMPAAKPPAEAIREPSKPIEIAKLAAALDQADQNDAAKSARISTSMPIDESQLEEVDEPPPPPPPKRTIITTTPPPVPAIVESRARTREPTPLPLLPKRKEDDTLPVGKFVYPTKKSGSGKRIAIFLLLAVVAAAGGIAFVKLVLQRPAREAKPELAVAPAIDAGEIAPSIDAQADVVAPVDAADIPEIDIEPGSAANVAPPPQPHHPIAHPAAHADAGAATPASTIDAGEAIEDGCDEVSCVTTHYDKACCARWKPADDNYRPHVGLAETLDKVMVREAMDNVKPRVIACGEQNPAKGIVKLAVSVGGDGSVKSVSVVDAPLPALGQCVAAAVKEASFAKTGKGGSFNYPFAF
ncbi:MAG TPA: molybdopterin-binding protein [Kofleriaceae bacterium]|nr:molybdopterin-binding protein [Kofleriaceae bacterium]